MEHERFENKTASKIFFREADLISASGEKALSLSKFANLAM
jgi:hypothetical protein